MWPGVEGGFAVYSVLARVTVEEVLGFVLLPRVCRVPVWGLALRAESFALRRETWGERCALCPASVCAGVWGKQVCVCEGVARGVRLVNV